MKKVPDQPAASCKKIFTPGRQSPSRVKKTAKELKNFNLVFDSIHDGAVVIDTDGYIAHFNQAYGDFLGIDPDYPIGKHCTEIIENTRMHIVAKTGKPINIKKGQFLAPWDMKNVIDKARETGNQQIMACERGVSFGYNNLVSDMRSLAVMRETNCPVVYDATHSVQQPGGLGGCSGGNREFVPVLARAAVASGVSGLFMETHPDPDKALSDGPNSWPLDKMSDLIKMLMAIDQLVKSKPFAEDSL